MASAIRVIHEKSILAERPEFDLFSAPLTDASIAHTTYESVSPSFPLAAEENQVVCLFLPRDPVNYIDLSRSYLELRIKGTGADVSLAAGSTPGAGEAASPVVDDIKKLDTRSAWTVVNNIGSSIFEIAKVTINDYNIFHSSNYPYQAIMTKLLNVTKDNLDSVQLLAGFALEEQKKMERWSFGNVPAVEGRVSHTHQGRTMTIFDRLYIPITYAYKLLPNNVSIRIELTQSKNAFSIIAAQNRVTWTGGSTTNRTPAVSLRIVGLTWHVCKVRPYDHILEANNIRMLREPALYFFPRRDLRVFIIGSNQQSFHQLVYQGRKPRSVTLGMVKDSSALGNYFTTPFGFEAFGLTRCSLTVNNLLPAAPLEFDFSGQPRRWQAGYRMLSDSTGHNAEYGAGPLISPEYYTDGNFLLHYSLSNNLSSDNYLESAEPCNINLSLEFGDALTDAVRLIVLSRFDDFVECMGPERTFLPSYAPK